MWPWDWIKAAGSAISGLSQKAVDWVNSLVASVMSWVTDSLNAVWSSITGLWNDITGVWNKLVGFIEHTAETIWNTFYRWTHIIADWITGMISQLWQYAQGIYNWALKQINAVWNYIFQFARDIYSWILRNIWDPLYQDFQNATAWASQWFNQIWQYIEHPELLVNLLGRYLLTVWLQLVKQFAVPLVRWLIRAMRTMAGEVFDLLESVISSII